MEFKMNESGLQFNNTNDKAVVLINTVSRFVKRQINGARLAKTQYVKLVYPSVKYFRWIVQIKKII